ncbi:MAG: DNA polymerase III subunit delta [Bacteroidales bacterium]|nr:DNA polymerase III subunit delta [Bacteroidales bacterium]
MYFKEIIGQEVLKSRLVQTVQENRVSHAWLFFGPEGSGALPLALAFAGYILCTSRGEDDACGICAGCNKNSKYIHPDLHFVYPVNKTRAGDRDNVVSDDFMADWRSFLLRNPYGRLTQWYDFIDLENKQGIINTEESKRLSGKLNLKAFESDYKVVILWHPEKMNDQASNKLLKLLEEPPPLTVFILVSENPDQLLATVKSRCIPVKVARIGDEALTEALINKHSLDAGRAVEFVRLASGNYLKALDLISEAEDIRYNFEKFRELMRSCFKKSIPELYKETEELASLTREKQKSFLEYGLRTLRESLALHLNEPELVFLADAEKEFTTNFAPFVHGINILALTEEFSKAIQDIERNANGRIVFLDMALKLSELIKN